MKCLLAFTALVLASISLVYGQWGQPQCGTSFTPPCIQQVRPAVPPPGPPRADPYQNRPDYSQQLNGGGFSQTRQTDWNCVARCTAQGGGGNQCNQICSQ